MKLKDVESMKTCITNLQLNKATQIIKQFVQVKVKKIVNTKNIYPTKKQIIQHSNKVVKKVTQIINCIRNYKPLDKNICTLNVS